MNYFDFSIYPKKSLHENVIFWWATLTPLSLSLLLAVLLIPELNFEISVKGYKYFLTAFSLPLGIASISIILGVMVGRFHSSKQSAISISQNESNFLLARKNQTFQHYFEHRTQFENWIKLEGVKLSILDQSDAIDVNAMGLYDLLFSSNSIEYLEYSVDREELFHHVLSKSQIISFELTNKDSFSAEWACLKLLSFINIQPFKTKHDYWAPYYDRDAFIELVLEIPRVIYKSSEFLLLTGLDSDDVNLYEIFEILIKELDKSSFFEKLNN
ncbi:hypothetical protein J8L73_03760 [Pseudoalteromonas sp. MMG006]|uniref:hypothetical protein n=1 Tax=Pseudoalteromonas sp. MMG006 TaxID=2822683 RepID=UPI001B35FEA4|nr:hypothetical protein [Pseudoalteromonas sp. MMG006]MBQ4798262.1 hypothetical protein [Pseudoalteromonas sp. MMG006]